MLLGDCTMGIRMRKLILALGLLACATPGLAANPVVVELYTSQGCSSCPPADQVLAELDGHDYVIALALHVDYWDYLGWADDFANPQFSARQRRYARAWRERSVYTPQMVIHGSQYMVGSRGDEVQRQIMMREDMPAPVNLSVAESGDATTVSLTPAHAPVGEATVYLVRYSPGETVEIQRGENAGKRIHYVNIVESWDTIANWGGDAGLTLQIDNLSSGNYVLIVQQAGQGEILVAEPFTR